MSLNPVDILYLLTAIEKANYILKGKEIGLIKSMKCCIDNKRYATPGQSKFLQDIYCRAYGGGDHQNRGYV